MSPFRQIARAAVIAALSAAPFAGALATPANASTTPRPSHTPRHRHAVTPLGGLIRHTAQSTSVNWAGYAAVGSRYTSVSATFTLPALDCGSGDGYSAFWVGLDGFTSQTVEQTGIEADCTGGVAGYSAWYELYPGTPVTYDALVRPGDAVSVRVGYVGAGGFVLTVTDSTEGWQRSASGTLGNAARSSAEVITEAPFGDHVLPLADFGTVRFTGTQVDGTGLSAFKPVGVDMVSPTGTLKATVSGLSANAFSVTWHSF